MRRRRPGPPCVPGPCGSRTGARGGARDVFPHPREPVRGLSAGSRGALARSASRLLRGDGLSAVTPRARRTRGSGPAPAGAAVTFPATGSELPARRAGFQQCGAGSCWARAARGAPALPCGVCAPRDRDSGWEIFHIVFMKMLALRFGESPWEWRPGCLCTLR